ncbi:TPA: hypothetical protein HA265_00200 [Candidatus Woesearchaeota archaeon]|nr:hypothetical protein [Candidatus Woesearchaeota archaeon]
MDTKNTISTKSTTIRISQKTKERLSELAFVRKHTYDDILTTLIEFYEARSDSEG